MRRIIIDMGNAVGHLSGSFKNRKNQNGQVAILFALVFTFMFVLFAFVVDFGEIIQDKINLQLAADAAAYSGAAWQARILNRIGALNYRLRQDVKELAMRVNVTHLRHNIKYPRGQAEVNGGDAPVTDTDLLICQQASGYTSISGIHYAQDTNLCRNASPRVGGLPPIIVPTLIADFDAFQRAIQAQLKAIQAASNRECRSGAFDNRELAAHLADVYTRRSRFHASQIEELAGFMNQVNGQRPSNSNHPMLQTAYQSAIRNLTRSNNDSFQMEVLQPRGGEYLRLKQYKMKADILYMKFRDKGSGCVGIPDFYEFDDMISGYSKSQEILTYFAVKLTTKPRLLFMPAAWGDAFPELQAISIAKPFGSRIGPEDTADILLPVPNRPGNTNRYLNFSFKPNDTLGIVNRKMMAFFDSLHPFNSAGWPDGNQFTGWPDANKSNGRMALQAVRSPTVFDSIVYTIFPDIGPHENTDYVKPEYAKALYPDYLEDADENGNLIQVQRPKTPPYFSNAVGSRNNGPGWIQINANSTNIQDPYTGYAEEGLSSHSVTSILSLNDPIINGSENKAAEFGFATPKQIHSGWAPATKEGRIGYSVKFISMDTLLKMFVTHSSGQQGNIQNEPTGDPNISKVLH